MGDTTAVILGGLAIFAAGSIIAAPYKVMTPLRQIVSEKWRPDSAAE